jgi:hypothetical protein
MKDDGTGGQTQGGKAFLYTDIAARITIMNSEQQQQIFGFGGKEIWSVILQYSPKVENTGKFYLVLTQCCKQGIIPSDGIYRIIRSRHQRDQYNNYHHTSLAIEKDAQAEEV